MITPAAPSACDHENLAEAFTLTGHSDGPVPSSPCGRPRALNQAGKKLVAQLVLKGFTLGEAAAFLACDRDTILNERKRDPLFDHCVRRAKQMRNMNPMEVIRHAARTSWRAAAWLIEHRQKAEEQARKVRQQRAGRRLPQPPAASAQPEAAASPATPVSPAAGFSAPAPVLAPVSPSPAPSSATETQAKTPLATNGVKPIFRRRLRSRRRRLARRRTSNKESQQQRAGSMVSAVAANLQGFHCEQANGDRAIESQALQYQAAPV